MKTASAFSILATAILVLTAGCKSEPKPVSFYLETNDVRTALIKECKDDVTRAKTDGDCLNAFEAQRQIQVKEARAQQKAYNEHLEKKLKERQAATMAEWEATKAPLKLGKPKSD